MKNYGCLLGKVLLRKDTHHDEVYIEETGLVVMENNIWRYEPWELTAIARTIIEQKEKNTR